MKKIGLLITGLFLFSQFSFGQDAKAKAVLDAVSNNLKTMKSMKANFSLTISKTKETKKGSVSMKGTKYFVSIGSGQEIYCDSKSIYTYNKAAKEVTVNSFDPNENAFTPTKLFTNFYDKEYKSKFMGEKVVGGVAVNIIQLTPTKPKQFTKIEVTVDKVKNLITSGKIFEKNGNIMSYTISNVQVNPTIADAVFVFDKKKHPGVEVVDLD